jgi:hypothetical protein
LWIKNYKYNKMENTIPKIPKIDTQLNKRLPKKPKFLKGVGSVTESASELSGDGSKPPKKLYEAAATLALLTGAALEGAGLALNEAIQEKKMNVNEARQIVGNLAKKGLPGKLGQAGGNAENTTAEKPTSSQASTDTSSTGRNDALSMNLPPGVELATDTILDVASKAKTIVGDGLDIAAKRTYQVGSELLDEAVDAVVPVELLNKTYGELNPALTAKLSAMANNFEAMAKDPEARAAISNLAKATADVGITAVDAAMPNINRLVDRVWVVANSVGSKSVRSAVNVGLAMLVTALSEVPVVGGMVVGGLEAGTVFNNVVATSSKAIQGFSQIARDSMDTMSVVADSVGKTQGQLVTPINQVKGVYNKYSGGGRDARNRTRKAGVRRERIKIERRLRKSIKAFLG